MKGRLFRLFAGVVAVLALTAPVVSAAQALDVTKTGAIHLTLREQGEAHRALPGGEISMYKVAEAVIQDGTLGFSYTEGFSGCNQSLENTNAPELPGALVDYGKSQNLAPLQKQVSGDDGKVSFLGLPAGLYLFDLTGQADNVQGTYTMKPFLVSVPMMNGEGTGWNYTVDATPKLAVSVGPMVDVKVEKRWVDDKPADRPDSITVELWGNSQCADTAQLSEKNNWSHIFRNLDASVDWTVRETNVPQGYQVSYHKDSATNTIVITNTKIYKKPPPLIQTGQLNWPIPLLAGTGMLLMLAGWVMNRAEKKEN